MPLLPDWEIKRQIVSRRVRYEPYDERLVNPASIDMRLSPLLREPISPVSRTGSNWIDLAAVPEGHTRLVEMDDVGQSQGYLLDPGEMVLGTTIERIRLSEKLVARVEGKSSLGRLGLAVHITAGFIDPGFEGQITLEIVNLSPWSIVLRSGMRVAQMAFETLNSPPDKAYGQTGHYQAQSGPTESRYSMRNDV